MVRFKKIIFFIANRANWISALAIVLMMLMTVADVVLRFFRCPIPGTYDVVGLLAALTISFSLGYTSIEKGHISVEYIMQKFSDKVKIAVNAINNFIATLFFAVAAWESAIYAMNLKQSGEVSLTLQIPFSPILYGMSVSSMVVCLVLLVDFFKVAGGAAEPWSQWQD